MLITSSANLMEVAIKRGPNPETNLNEDRGVAVILPPSWLPHPSLPQLP